MFSSWKTLSWIMIVAAQIACGYGLALLLNSAFYTHTIDSIMQFLTIPLSIFISYLIGVYGIGMLGLVLKKYKPYVAGLRLLTTATMAIIPMLVLVFNAVTLGLEDQKQFYDLVIDRMVPYYTQLCTVFALLGFYITLWWHKAVPVKVNPKSR